MSLQPIIDRIELLQRINVSPNEIDAIISDFERRLTNFLNAALDNNRKSTEELFEQRKSEAKNEKLKRIGVNKPKPLGSATPRFETNRHRSRSVARLQSVVVSTTKVRFSSVVSEAEPINRKKKSTEECSKKRKKAYPIQSGNIITRQSLRSYTRQMKQKLSDENELAESEGNCSLRSPGLSPIVSGSPYSSRNKLLPEPVNIFSPFAAVHQKNNHMNAVSTPSKGTNR